MAKASKPSSFSFSVTVKDNVHRAEMQNVLRQGEFEETEIQRSVEEDEGSEKRRGTEVKKTTVTRRSVEGKVKESFAVVKKSKDPYEDLRKSMITEMEMSEAEDLEQLLQCFLALNSRSYHAVIVRAFMEIWQQMFVMKNLQTNVKTQEK
ncbi:hypothetical protein JHK82_019456 [Glycine max]|nr:hypothetical protein JHK85_019896 [Glycine max]KAG5038632.1 hypothetical protein JHK86_019472 [Glycine max]KAG5143761.1 hypothetical protein JHK82_019456 [Glycine max]